MARADKGIGPAHQGKSGPKGAGERADENVLHQEDIAQETMGRNRLQGDDQANVRNQRHAQPEARGKADASVTESFEKMDKDVRARRDLGKGARQ